MARSRFIALAAILAACLFPPPARAEAPAVVVSIKPIHALVAAVMQGVSTPALIVKGGASPHSYALTPSDAAAIQQAKIVFWIGEGMETFLHKVIDTLPQQARSVALADAAGVTRLPVREGGVWDEHLEQSGEAHADEPYDGHLWLDPVNAKAMTAVIVQELSAADPAHAAVYAANGEGLAGRLDVLDGEIAAALASVKDVPFIVFHDAFQYFDRRYGLAGVGSITVNPELPPGAKRLREIQAKIAARQARCVFREPNFAPSLVETVVADTEAKIGVLDPEGAGLEAGPDLYFGLMRNAAKSLRECLTPSS
jgi:zinc transport system substrate-binding protein